MPVSDLSQAFIADEALYCSGYFYSWREVGLFERINHFLLMFDREREGREASPSVGIIDCQSAKQAAQNSMMAARKSSV